MNNFQLIQTNDISDGMHCEAQAAMFHGAMANQYEVTNPAWNKRIAQLLSEALEDERALEPFIDHMTSELNCEHIQSIRFCETRNTHLFTAMNF
jgi:hypothetical protein